MRGIAALALVGCTTDAETVSYARAGEVLPDFALEDVNETSPTAGATVSVADQRGSVSAWYFGHST